MRSLAEERGYDLAESYSYSDSHTDLPMLDIVGHPFAVNPDTELRTHRRRARLADPRLRQAGRHARAGDQAAGRRRRRRCRDRGRRAGTDLVRAPSRRPRLTPSPAEPGSTRRLWRRLRQVSVSGKGPEQAHGQLRTAQVSGPPSHDATPLRADFVLPPLLGIDVLRGRVLEAPVALADKACVLSTRSRRGRRTGDLGSEVPPGPPAGGSGGARSTPTSRIPGAVSRAGSRCASASAARRQPRPPLDAATSSVSRARSSMPALSPASPMARASASEAVRAMSAQVRSGEVTATAASGEVILLEDALPEPNAVPGSRPGAWRHDEGRLPRQAADQGEAVDRDGALEPDDAAGVSSRRRDRSVHMVEPRLRDSRRGRQGSQSTRR